MLRIRRGVASARRRLIAPQNKDPVVRPDFEHLIPVSLSTQGAIHHDNVCDALEPVGKYSPTRLLLEITRMSFAICAADFEQCVSLVESLTEGEARAGMWFAAKANEHFDCQPMLHISSHSHGMKACAAYPGTAILQSTRPCTTIAANVDVPGKISATMAGTPECRDTCLHSPTVSKADDADRAESGCVCQTMSTESIAAAIRARASTDSIEKVGDIRWRKDGTAMQAVDAGGVSATVSECARHLAARYQEQAQVTCDLHGTSSSVVSPRCSASSNWTTSSLATCVLVDRALECLESDNASPPTDDATNPPLLPSGLPHASGTDACSRAGGKPVQRLERLHGMGFSSNKTTGSRGECLAIVTEEALSGPSRLSTTASTPEALLQWRESRAKRRERRQSSEKVTYGTLLRREHGQFIDSAKIIPQ